MLTLLVVSCKNEEQPKINVQPSSELTSVPSEGGTYDVAISSAESWIIKEQDLNWVRLARYGSGNDQRLKVEVESNLSEQARTLTLKLISKHDIKEIAITQQGKPAGQELKYRLPIVFHVLYKEEADKTLNLPQEKIYEVLKEVNRLYAVNGINLEFVPATISPSGTVMREAGIHRVQWVSEAINPVDMMTNEDPEYLHLLWDPNKYINVMLYKFTIPNILGIATFPLTPEQNPLVGMDVVPFTNLDVRDLNRLRGISLNVAWTNADEKGNPFAPYVSKELLDRQVSLPTTLAHELGHLLGLRHAFAEGPDGACVDTDYCEDTPSYSKRPDYDDYVSRMMSDAQYNPYFPKEFRWESLFERTACDGSKFVSHNIMDYSYSYMDQFSPQQKERIRHVLDYSPFIPGPKKTVVSSLRDVRISPERIPHSISICYAPGAHSH